MTVGYVILVCRGIYTCPGQLMYMIRICECYTDELTGFEEVWNGNARKHLPGWSGSSNVHDTTGKIRL